MSHAPIDLTCCAAAAAVVVLRLFVRTSPTDNPPAATAASDEEFAADAAAAELPPLSKAAPEAESWGAERPAGVVLVFMLVLLAAIGAASPLNSFN